ncbi:hypothetical protein WG907_16990 [Sphingobium sp. AN558]|uniref:hypothetical protein n=1 Tax=Sphingobium sp. AN558 TaxID=3133442 RepID=UPI0030C510E8
MALRRRSSGDRGRRDAAGVGDVDLCLAAVLVAKIVAIDVGSFDSGAGQALDLVDLPCQGVTI